MRYINIAPMFPEHFEYMVSEAKRLHQQAGLNESALILSMHPEGKDPFAKIDKATALFRRYRDALAGMNMHISILIQSLIGHWPKAPTADVNWQRSVTIGAQLNRWCVLDPEFCKYVRQVFVSLAKEEPYSLLIDDDVRQNYGEETECFCPIHIKRLNNVAQKNWTCEQWRSAVRSALPGDEILVIFEQVRNSALLEFTDFIRVAIDEVNPQLRCGYCTPTAAARIAEPVALSLAGKTEPFLRVNNALYQEGSIKEFFPVTMGYTRSFAVRNNKVTEILDESDTFPQTLYSKSAAGLHAHISGAILNGCRGAKLWIANYSNPVPAEQLPYDQILIHNHRYYDILEETMRQARRMGPAVPVKPAPPWQYNERNALRWSFDWGSTVFGRLGIPHTYDLAESDNTTMLLSGKEMITAFSDSILLCLLEKNVLLDGDAARAVIDRGFGKYLGVDIEKEEIHAHFEWNPANRERLAFFNLGNYPKLIPWAETQVVSELCKLDSPFESKAHSVGAGCTVWNKPDGRITVVTAMNLADGDFLFRTPERKRLLLEIVSQLSSDPLFSILENQDIWCAQYEISNGGKLLALINLGFDSLECFHLRIHYPVSQIKYLSNDGKWNMADIQVLDKTAVINLPVPVYGVVILRLF